MTVLTATNERVQAYLKTAPKPSTKATKARLEMLKDLLASAGTFFSELFPRKQSKVLNEIVFLTAANGVAKIGADKLAARAGVSERTVSTVVSKLKKTGDYVVGRINAGQAGKYIFVDKKHADFERIMQFLFDKDATQLANQNATQFASLENAENVEPQAIEDEKEAPNSFIPSIPFSSLKDFDLNNITANNENDVDTEAVRKESLLSKIPNALRNVTLFFDDIDKIYELNGIVFLAKDKSIRIEDHEQLFAKTIKDVFEYYKRKVKEVPDYNVFGLMRKAIRELSDKILNGTAYPKEVPATDEPINGVTQAMIDNAADAFEKQNLLNQRNGKAKKATGRTENLPDWFATRHEQTEEQLTAVQEAELAEAHKRMLEKLGY